MMSTEDLVYIVLGILLTSTNLLIFTAIVIHKALRNHKEYVLLGLLVFFNTLLGLGFASAGMYRASLAVKTTSRYQCLSLPHIYLLAGSPCAVSLLLPCIAIDRLVAVTRPLFYYSLHRQYALYIATMVVIVYLSCLLFAITQALANPGLLDAECDTRNVFGSIYKRFESGTIAFGHLTAVLIYLVVIGQFRRKTKLKLGRVPRGNDLVDARGRRIVRTFGLFALLTLVIVVLPYSAVLTADYVLTDTSVYRTYIDDVYLICTKLAIMNPTLNVVLYALRHNEIYVGVQTMLRGQTMPESTDQWRLEGGGSLPVVRRALSLQITPRHKYSLAHYQMMKHIDDDRQRRERSTTRQGSVEPSTKI